MAKDDAPIIEIKEKKAAPKGPKKQAKNGFIIVARGKYRAVENCFDGVRYYKKDTILETNGGEEIPMYFEKM